MLKILRAAEMNEVDRLSTAEFGIPSLSLMENAAIETLAVISQAVGGSVAGKRILVLCGKGNNGGDGAAAARLAMGQGAFVTTILFGEVDDTAGDAEINFRRLQTVFAPGDRALGESTFIQLSPDSWRSALKANETPFDVIVDALFGTGLSRPIGESFEPVFEYVGLAKSEARSITVSVDLPSGLSADLPEPIGKHISADITVTFTAPKIANVLPPASNFNGKLHIADIGSPRVLVEKAASDTYLTELDDVREWMKNTSFSSDSYKKSRGSVLLVVGSRQYPGAAVLAGSGAMRSGAGVVTVLTPESAYESVSKRMLPEVIVRGIAGSDDGSVSLEAFEEISNAAGNCDVLAVGSGLTSTAEGTRALVRKLVEFRTTPIVIDADGLNVLSPFELYGSKEFPLVLTPHEGEFLRLTGTNRMPADRVKTVRDFAVRHRLIMVLKGERILIGSPEGKVLVNPTGNSGLGKAGNGDNLTGIIAGFVAQGIRSDVEVFESVTAAVYTAGLSGDIAAERFGKRVMLATEVRECMAAAFKSIEE